jgi:hypothetical protein
MISRDFGANNNPRPTTLGSSFTSDELARLDALRRNYTNHAEYLERVIDDRRMEFARFLLEHGRLSEGIDA